MKRTIAVDFDGVLHAYSKGWHDGSIYDEPMPRAREAMQALRDAGFELIIWTTRAHERITKGIKQPAQVDELRVWLARHRIPYDRIWTEPGKKPLCVAFIDDNAISHVEWTSTLFLLAAKTQTRSLFEAANISSPTYKHV